MEETIHTATGEELTVFQPEPGRYLAAAPLKARIHGFVKMIPEPGQTGKFLPSVTRIGDHLTLTDNLLRDLGIPVAKAARYLRRLHHAQLVIVRQLSPTNAVVDTASLADFLRDSADPDFWTEGRRRAYSLACKSIQ